MNTVDDDLMEVAREAARCEDEEKRARLLAWLTRQVGDELKARALVRAAEGR